MKNAQISLKMLSICVLSYNVQAPFLPSPEGPITFPSNFAGFESPAHRRKCVWFVIERALRASQLPTFVCLQEVCEDWREWFINEFRGYDMESLQHNYAPPHVTTPLYTMIFYPTKRFECRINAVLFTGVPTNRQQVETLGLSENDVTINSFKRHAVLSGTFRERRTGKGVVVGTYHAPCIFKMPHCLQLHIENAVDFVYDQFGISAVLAGDFNMKPTDRAYRQVVASDPDGIIDADATEHRPTNASRDFCSCLDYMFSNRYAQPKSFDLHGFHSYPFLTNSQPSDHALLKCVFDCV